ncbi:MAG: hypothetical protein WC091_06455 [Sulfuricellaceae bacterium]
MNRLIDKLRNMFTAMAYAEAGDLDAVKQILRVESDKQEPTVGATRECAHQPVVPAI